MKRSIFYIIILAVLFAMMIVSTSRADGLRDPAFNTSLPDQHITMPPVQTASYGGAYSGYGYAYGYDPYGPPLYSPWNSSRCYDCSKVWDNYGCHEFKQGGHGGNCGKHGGCQGGAACADGGCTASADYEAAPADAAQPETVEPTTPPEPPMPTEEKSASSGNTWPQASGLFPVVNN